MTEAEILESASEYGREAVLKTCAALGMDSQLIVKEIMAGIKAKEVKPHYDRDAGAFVYSKPLVAWAARLKAIDQAISILGLKAPDKHDVTSAGKALDFNSISPTEREELLAATRMIQAMQDGKS